MGAWAHGRKNTGRSMTFRLFSPFKSGKGSLSQSRRERREMPNPEPEIWDLEHRPKVGVIALVRRFVAA